jgi:hypothetical protein
VVTDWKTASVWKVTLHDFDDWKKQGMIYAWLLSKNGLPIRKCRFVALLKDHSKTKAGYGNGYPESPVYVYEFDVTEKGLRETENFIKAKTQAYKMCLGKTDEVLPVCGEHERWSEPAKHAVMKQGRKSAVRLFDGRKEADDYADSLGINYYVVTRPGADRKCLNYCRCREFCVHYQAIRGEQEASQ